MEYMIIGSTKGTSGLGHWKVDRPMNVKPKIVDSGAEYYVDESGRQYIKDAFDKMFGKPVGKVEKKRKSKV